MKLISSSERPALVGNDLQISYNLLLSNIAAYAVRFSVQPGERLLIFSENRPEWIYSLYAGWIKGSIVVPVDVLSTSDDLAYILKDSKPAMICCSAERRPLVDEALHISGHSCPIFVFENFEPVPFQKPESLTISDTGKPALILYTSGTTGDPKGVMLSFLNILTNLTAVCHDVKIYTPEDRVMILLPLHHILPLVGTVVAPLYMNATMVLNTSLAAEDLMATLRNFKVTIMIGVPRLYQLIYKGLREKIHASAIARVLVSIAGFLNSQSFSGKVFASVHNKFGGHIRFLVCGGAPIDAAVVKLFKTLGFQFLEGYGMTETAPMITFTRPGAIVPGVPGQLLPGIRIRFEEQEVVVSGNNVMMGYYNKPDDTAAVLTDGWLRTGDLGYLDEKGYLHITGRKKEIIVLPNGKNINPEEIERELLRTSVFIKESGVFLKDGILQAIIRPDFKQLSEAGISDHMEYFRWQVIDRFNQSVTPYKKILRFHFSGNELPRTRLGKIKRFMLPEMTGSKKLHKTPEPQSREYQAIKKFLESETQQTVQPSDHLELDLALDSLGRVSLSAFIETAFGVDVPENGFSEFQSVAQLADHVHLKKTRSATEGISWSQILKEKVHINLPKSWITHNLFKQTLRLIFTLFIRIRSRGMENLPDQACIITPNHQSILDGFLVVSLFKRKFIKNTYVYAKEKHFRGRILRFLAQRNNIILVDVNKDLKLSIQKLAAVLKKGKNLVIFPEGTRSLTGKLGDFKQTFAILSQELQVPVVPVVIRGSYDVLPSGSHFPRLFRRVSVEFLQPVYPVNHSYESLKEIVYNRLAHKLDE